MLGRVGEGNEAQRKIASFLLSLISTINPVAVAVGVERW